MEVRYLTLSEVLVLYQGVMRIGGGEIGIRDLGALRSAVEQPRMSFGGVELYPGLAEKAGALVYSIVKGHPFVDGNKRAAHAAMEVFLVLNGYEIEAREEEQEEVMLQVAGGEMERGELVEWIKAHMVERRAGAMGIGQKIGPTDEL